VPGLLLLFPLDCACGAGAHGGGRLSEVGSSGKVNLSEKVVLVLLAVEAGAVKKGSRPCHHGMCYQGMCHQGVHRQGVCYQGVHHQGVCRQGRCQQGGFGILPSKRVSSRWILGRAVKVGAGFLKQVKGASTSLRVQILFMAVAAGKAVTRARGSGSVGASRAGQVWIRYVPSKVRSGFAPCPAGKCPAGKLDLGSSYTL